MVYCCVPYCVSHSDKKIPGISFHEFPSRLDLRNKWLKLISRENFCVNDKSNSSVICSKHFREEDYLKTPKRKRLLPNAEPSIFENYPSYMQPTSSRKRKSVFQREAKEKPEKPVKRKRSCTDTDCPKLDENPHPLPSPECNEAVPDIRSILDKKRNEVKLLKCKLWKKNTEIENLKEHLERVEEKLKYYEKNEYHSELEKLIIMSEEVGYRKATFILNQIDNFFVKRPTWNEEVIRECFLWNASSPKGYNCVQDRKLLTLPSKI